MKPTVRLCGERPLMRQPASRLVAFRLALLSTQELSKGGSVHLMRRRIAPFIVDRACSPINPAKCASINLHTPYMAFHYSAQPKYNT
jgi:hypothetical protein